MGAIMYQSCKVPGGPEPWYRETSLVVRRLEANESCATAFPRSCQPPVAPGEGESISCSAILSAIPRRVHPPCSAPGWVTCRGTGSSECCQECIPGSCAGLRRSRPGARAWSQREAPCKALRVLTEAAQPAAASLVEGITLRGTALPSRRGVSACARQSLGKMLICIICEVMHRDRIRSRGVVRMLLAADHTSWRPSVG